MLQIITKKYRKIRNKNRNRKIGIGINVEVDIPPFQKQSKVSCYALEGFDLRDCQYRLTVVGSSKSRDLT